MPEKLVRDLIPDVIRASGEIPVVRRCEPGERRGLLLAKLVEECLEYAETGELGEAADIFEVVEALAVLDDPWWEDVLRVKADKRAARGGFAEGWVWSGNVTPQPPVV